MKNLMTNKEIRDYLSHNGRECKVRVNRDGTVERYGSPDHGDRSQDHWKYMGTREELTREMMRDLTR